MNADPILAADHLLSQGRKAEAAALVARAAANGDAKALFQQGLWLLAGQVVPRDISAARAAFIKAAHAGHSEARLVTASLAANGTGAPPDWAGALRTLRSADAANDQYARHLLSLLARMSLTAEGSPTTLPLITPLTADGTIGRVTSLLTTEECGHIANSVADMLAPSSVVDPVTGCLIQHPVRTSDAAVVSPVREDPVLRAINQRIAAVSKTDVRQGEALTILRYLPGQQFRLHADTLPGVRNQRVMTVILYLNDSFEGGETVFPLHDLRIVPRAGDALIFDNVDASGQALAQARHAGDPVTRGVKWIATRWIRARPFDVWQGPESV